MLLAILASSTLIWAALGDVRSRHIPIIAGFGMLAVGLAVLLINELWLETVFYVAAIWGSRGGIWRLPILISGVALLAQGLESLPFVIGTLYVLAIFELGWFGGGDAQLALGLMAIGRDWWIMGYLFGGTILLGFSIVLITRGLRGGAKRLWWVLRHMDDAPDDQALKVPWGILATFAGLLYIWVFPGLMMGLRP